MRVPPVHGVGAGREGLSALAPVGGRAGLLAVDQVGRDREDRLRVHGVAIGRVLPDLGHEGLDQPDRQLVHPIVVVAEGRKLALDAIVHRQPVVVTHDLDPGVLDGGQAVRHD